MDETMRAIIKASHFGISIVIVGVGNADFTKMEALDCDGCLLRIGKKVAARDIVQFVPFNRFNRDPSALAREVLAEIPRQMVEYMKMKGIQPNQMAHVPLSEVRYNPTAPVHN